MKKFRPSSTIFEIGNSSKNAVMSGVMSQKRAKHSILIEKFRSRNEKRNNYKNDDQLDEKSDGIREMQSTNDVNLKPMHMEESSKDDLDSAFGKKIFQSKAITNAKVFVHKKQKKKEGDNQDAAKKPKSATKKDEENYIGYHC